MPFHDRSIDAVVASHPHADHIDGLIEVLRRYDVGAIVQARETYDSGNFRQWQDTVAEEHAIEVEAIAGTTLDLGSEVILTVLHPFFSVAGTKTKTPHDDVVVAMLRYKDVSVLLTGDMEAKIERLLIAKHADLDADVLKVGHHGSKTSSTPEFLAATTPRLAVISVGAKNRYRHPSTEVLSRLEKMSIPYYRTDIDGGIVVESDGNAFRVIPNRR